MREKYAKRMMGKIENAIYSAFCEQYLEDGDGAVEAHRKATAMTDQATALIKQTWLTLRGIAAEPDKRPRDSHHGPLDKIMWGIFHGF